MEIEIYRLNKSGLGQDNDVVRGPDFHTYPHEAPFPPRAIFFWGSVVLIVHLVFEDTPKGC